MERVPPLRQGYGRILAVSKAMVGPTATPAIEATPGPGEPVLDPSETLQAEIAVLHNRVHFAWRIYL